MRLPPCSRGCGALRESADAAPTVGVPVARTASQVGYELIYDFTGSPDGFAPSATFLEVNGLLYGTTRIGGANGRGTVFVYDPSGSERAIYSFNGSPDGDQPMAGLVDLNGVLYGTTSRGGTYGIGTVFRVTTSGKERVLYSFKGPPDGANPYTALAAANGVFYGTTSAGGDASCVPSSSGPMAVVRFLESRLPGEKRLSIVFTTARRTVRCHGHHFFQYELRSMEARGMVGCTMPVSCTRLASMESYRVVYSFKGPPDGTSPMGQLIIWRMETFTALPTKAVTETPAAGAPYSSSAKTERRSGYFTVLVTRSGRCHLPASFT